MKDYFDYFVNSNLDALYLVHQNLPRLDCEDNDEICKYLPSVHLFNYQIGFWKKDILKEMALPHENPWSSEWYGNKRAIAAGLDIRAINDKANDVFIYNKAGCVHRGKWLSDAVAFLNQEGFKIDYSKRGLYQTDHHSFKARIKLKLTFILHGLMGSYWRKIKNVDKFNCR